MDALLLAARLILAAVFVVSGISKLFDLSGSQAAMRSFGVPEGMTRAGGIALPIAELVIAVLLIPAATAHWGALFALILLLVFVAGIGYSLSRGKKIRLSLLRAIDDVRDWHPHPDSQCRLGGACGVCRLLRVRQRRSWPSHFGCGPGS